ncbi:MAG: DUF4349 domain-containing protein [Pseudomonadota bacterium]
MGGAGNAAPAAMEMRPAPPPQPGADAGVRRYIASKHQITLETPAAALQQQFLAIQAECIKLGCEIVESRQMNALPRQPPHAYLSARVPPAAFERFFTSAQAQARLIEHHTESEDKTADVIDVDARIKNAEALKARVLDLLAKRTGNMKEILEAEKQLAETQAELDSINGQRRALAKQTDMVRVEITLVAQSLSVEGSFAAPVTEALHESGRVLMSSLGALITFAVGALPWGLAITALVMFVLRLNRRRKRKAAAKSQAAS